VSPLHLPFSLRNFSRLLTNNHSINIYLNSVSKEWSYEYDEDNCLRVSKLKAVSKSGNEINISSKYFIIASGALESTRILLEAVECSKGLIKNTSQIGVGLGDHISIPIAKLSKESFSHFSKILAPKFYGAWMRSIRFIESNPENDHPRSFVHPVIIDHKNSFEDLKRLLISLQSRKIPVISIKSCLNIMKALYFIFITRLINKRLWISKTSDILLQLDMEQFRSSVNKVMLSNELDQYGRKKLSINWKISEIDMDAIRVIASRYLSEFEKLNKIFPKFEKIDIEFNNTKSYDAYHPAGVCAMGPTNDAVVDYDLKVNGVSNLYLISTGVFPTAGTQNPTLSMLCLANNLANKILNYDNCQK
jgi:hypothetical protein